MSAPARVYPRHDLSASHAASHTAWRERAVEGQGKAVEGQGKVVEGPGKAVEGQGKAVKKQ